MKQTVRRSVKKRRSSLESAAALFLLAVWLPVSAETEEAPSRKSPTVPGVTLRGRVVEHGTGEGLSGAYVNIRGKGFSRQEETGADGSFSFTNVPSGYYTFTVIPPPDRIERYERRAEPRLTVTVGDTDVDGVLLELKRPASIDGRVLEADGSPVGGARLGYQDPRGSVTLMHGKTGEDGEFTITPRETGDFRLYVETEDGRRYYANRVKIGTDEIVSGVEVVLSRGVTVSGKVKSPEGEPVGAVRVQLQPEKDAESAEGVALITAGTRSAGDGSFAFRSVPPGEYSLQAWNKIARRCFYGNRVTVFAEEGEDISELGLTIDLPDLEEASVSGVVVDGEGKPVQGCQVVRDAGPEPESRSAARYRHISTDFEGRFQYDEILAGTHTFSFLPSRRYAPVRGVEIAAPTDEVRVVLRKLAEGEELGSVSGTVTDAASGEPVEDFRASLVRRDRDQWRRFGPDTQYAVEASEEGNGRFRFDGIRWSDGWYVHAEAEGYLPGHSGEVVIDPGRETSGIAIQLERPAALAGKVVPAAGGPGLDGATVEIIRLDPRRRKHPIVILHHDEGEVQTVASTGEDGDFAATGLSEGNVVVRAIHPDYASGIIPSVTLTQGATAEIRVELSPGGNVQGRVVDDEGRPIASAGILLTPMPFGLEEGAAYQTYSEETRPDGTYSIAGVRPGGYAIVAELGEQMPAFGSTVRMITVRADDTVTVNFARSSASIQGVATVNGEPATGYEVSVDTPEGITCGMGETGVSSGRYEIKDIPAGEYVVQLESKSSLFPLHRVRVMLGSGQNLELDLNAEVADITGRVISATSEEELPSTRVSLFTKTPEDNGFNRRRVRRMETGEGGEFEFKKVPTGEYLLVAWRDHFGQKCAPIRVPKAGLSSLEVALGEYGTVAGRITRASGESVPETRWHARILAGQGSDSIQLPSGYRRSFGEGEFEVRYLSPGTYSVVVLNMDGALLFEEGVEVRPRATTRVDFKVPEEMAELEVSVLDEKGETISWGLVTLLSSEGTPLAEEAIFPAMERLRSFRKRLPPAVYRLSASRSGYTPVEREVDLRKVDGIQKEVIHLTPKQ